MLKPTKHTNPKYSIIYLAAKILSYLNKEYPIKYEELKKMLVNELGVKTKSNIDLSLTFLFSIGKIEYLKKIDAISLVNNEL